MALALERAHHVDALVLAHPMPLRMLLQTLVHIDTATVVAAINHETCRAAALHSTVHHAATVLTAAIRQSAQIVRLTVESILLQRVSDRATASESTFTVMALVRTAAIAKVTLVYVHALMMVRRTQLESHNANASIATWQILAAVRTL